MQKISAKDLYDKLQAEELQLIDVREVDEFTAGHVSGAQNLPRQQPTGELWAIG